MATYNELETYFSVQFPSNWEKILTQSFGYDIRDEMERQGISALEMVGYFNADKSIRSERLLGIIWGQKQGSPTQYEKIAAVLGLPFEELYTTSGLSRHNNVILYPQVGECGFDAAAKERGRTFCINVRKLWNEQNPGSPSYEMLYTKLGRSRHDFENVCYGCAPLNTAFIMHAAAALNLRNSPECVSMPARKVDGYPKNALRHDGTVDMHFFAYNLRMSMHIRLLEGKYFCEKTGRTSDSMFSLMAGRDKLEADEVRMLAQQLSLLEYHLLGNRRSGTEDEHTTMDDCIPDAECHLSADRVRNEAALRQQDVLANNLKYILSKKGYVRGGADADGTLCRAWQKVCPEIPLGILWGGALSDEYLFDGGQSEELLSRLLRNRLIAEEFGVSWESLTSSSMISAADIGKMRKEIFSAIDKIQDAKRLRTMLAMVDEEEKNRSVLTSTT